MLFHFLINGIFASVQLLNELFLYAAKCGNCNKNNNQKELYINRQPNTGSQ